MNPSNRPVRTAIDIDPRVFALMLHTRGTVEIWLDLVDRYHEDMLALFAAARLYRTRHPATTITFGDILTVRS
jgi:hypothetical protein